MATSAQTSVEARHKFARFVSCRCDCVTDPCPEACMERLISLLRAWLQANETGRDPRTSRAAEHNTVTRSTSREVSWLCSSNSCSRSTVACWIRRRVRPCLTGLCHLNRLGCIGRSRTQSGGSCSRWPPTSRTGSGRGRDPSYDSREGMDANRDMQAEVRYRTPRRTRRWLIEAMRYL